MYKNKFEKNGKFSDPAQHLFFVHIHHAIHHELPSKNHLKNITFPKTTLKNPSKRGKKAPDISRAIFF